jgi:tRNA threonylcarbamoyladenosine biosynthesis protein TsaB
VIILALDTAAALLSIALSIEDRTPPETWYVEIDAGQRHSELLMEIADNLLKTAGIVPADLDALACMKGPGSFTGLRIGCSAAQGMALALGVPCISIPTLDCIALPHRSWPGVVAPAVAAGKRCFFTALYRSGGPGTAERLTGYLDADAPTLAQAADAAAPDEPMLLTGPDAVGLMEALNGTPVCGRARLDPVCRQGRAKELAVLARAALAAGAGAEPPGLLYLRNAGAEPAKP